MRYVSWALAAVIALLSVRPCVNLLSPRQIMNTSFDPLELVNTYGAFGTVGRERLNVVFEGTDAETARRPTSDWKPYLYAALPVELDRRPRQIAPYQPRLDWQMWFAAMGSPSEYPWTLHLVWKLLHNDPGASSLFANNPFRDRPPRFVRATLVSLSLRRSREGAAPMVGTRAPRRMAASALRRGSPPASLPRRVRLVARSPNASAVTATL